MSKQVRQKARQRRRLNHKLQQMGRCLRCALVPDLPPDLPDGYFTASSPCAHCGRNLRLAFIPARFGNDQTVPNLPYFLTATTDNPELCLHACAFVQEGEPEPEEDPCDCGRPHALLIVTYPDMPSADALLTGAAAISASV